MKVSLNTAKLLNFKNIGSSIQVRIRILILTCIVFFYFESGYAQQWVTVDSTQWESVRVSYFDSLTGNYYLGGKFDTLFGVAAHGIIGFDGTNWFPMGSGTNGVVLSIIRFNGDLFIAGGFDSIGTTPIRVPMAKWDGTDWVRVDTISHFDDKLFSPNILPNIQDMCEFGGKLYLCGDFYAWPSSQNPNAYGDFARFNGSYIESFLFPWVQVNCSRCQIEVFQGDLYMGKSPATVDTCIGIPETRPEGLMRVDTICGHFIQIGQWPISNIYDMYSTDSILYIASNVPSSTMGYFMTGYDGTNFVPVGDGLNAPVGRIEEYKGTIVILGAFTANHANTTSIQYIAKLSGPKWVSIGSLCNLSYGFDYMAVLDTFIIGSGFFDSCGVNAVGSIVMFPGSIPTGTSPVIESAFEPKVLVENGIIRIETGTLLNSSGFLVELNDNLGRQLARTGCCEINTRNLSLSPGIYFLNIFNPTSHLKKSFKIALNFY